MEKELLEVEHHKQRQLCATRPTYRQGRKLTAVKVYSVASESQHLFVYGVPKINLRTELKALFAKYGKISTIHVIIDHKTEIFTECYHVQYERIQSARIAKRLLDSKSFYGGILHVCYAPEYENLAETKAKLEKRRLEVMRKLNNPLDSEPMTNKRPGQSFKEPERKRRKPALPLTEERMQDHDPMMVWLNVPNALDPRQPANQNKPSVPQKSYQIIPSRIEYGPYLENGNLLSKANNFIPRQVKTSKMVEKKIIFRKK